MLPQKARPLAFTMKEVEKELERLEKDGVISPEKHSEWTTPVVPVTTGDKHTPFMRWLQVYCEAGKYWNIPLTTYNNIQFFTIQ